LAARASVSAVRTLVVAAGGGGGIGRAERLIMLALGSLGTDVSATILSRRAYPAYLSANADSRQAVGPGFIPAFSARAVTQATRRRPDVILFTHVNLARLTPVVRAVCPRARILVFAHGIEVWDTLDPVRRRALRDADAVVTTARHTSALLPKLHGVEPSRVIRMPFALEPSWEQHARRETTSRRDPIVLTVSRLSRVDDYKGVDKVIAAVPAIARAIPDFQYRIVGDGDDRPRLEALARDLGVTGHVRFLRELTNEQLVREYAAARAFALPSTHEGFGLVFLEAMAFGVPIVAAPAAGALDVVADGETGLFADSSDGIAAHLTRLLSDGDLASAMGDAGRRRLLTEFSFARYVKRWSAALQTNPEAGARERPLAA
jgi:phosphatidyl-myo-inositol dimannoside synthase